VPTFYEHLLNRSDAEDWTRERDVRMSTAQRTAYRIRHPRHSQHTLRGALKPFGEWAWGAALALRRPAHRVCVLNSGAPRHALFIRPHRDARYLDTLRTSHPYTHTLTSVPHTRTPPCTLQALGGLFLVLVVFAEDLLEMRLIAKQKISRAIYAQAHDGGAATERQGPRAHSVLVCPCTCIAAASYLLLSSADQAVTAGAAVVAAVRWYEYEV
jgi:hypothetical protein